MTSSIAQRIADELSVNVSQVNAAIELLDGGATVPFIARYRKEATGALSDTALRTLDERLVYLREMEERRASILASIEEQGKLSDGLKAEILQAETKSRLEDLYLPYKPKRRTKGQIAVEQGLLPLAEKLLGDPAAKPESEAEAFINEEAGVAGVEQALEGARFILMERFAESADLLASLRTWLWQDGCLNVAVIEGKAQEAAKYRDYFEYDEPLSKVPSHRALAVFRGRNEGLLSLRIRVEGEPESRRDPHPGEGRVAAFLQLPADERPATQWLREVVRWTWRVKLYPALETDLFARLRDAAEEVAIDVFAANLKDLLLTAPAGQRVTLGMDPGLRTGVKVVVVDGTGKLLSYETLFPHAPRNDWNGALQKLVAMCQRHDVNLIAVGNGTASRETDKLAGDVLKALQNKACQKVMVSEAGASVYSASELAAKEFPDLDVSYRGAVSIARRLQDPLAELVKIEPKSIGVGQYQHDVGQLRLARALDAVVEDCVNAVGVDLNTASVPLLARVSGLNGGLAEQIVFHREQNGPFADRQGLLKVSRLGPKTFEQAAGFLRINGGKDPLDASAVHPEAYPVVEVIAKQQGCGVRELIGNSSILRQVDPRRLQNDQFGVYTIKDVLTELEKPGRDPRPEFRVASFSEGVETLNDLEPGMVLEGTVSNVTPFGAFVDIGVHQDGLVHVSALSETFVKDPRTVVKTGDVVKVKVMEVDVQRKRISLSMRLGDSIERQAGAQDSRSQHKGNSGKGGRSSRNSNARPSRGAENNARSMGSFGDLLMKAQQESRKQ